MGELRRFIIEVPFTVTTHLAERVVIESTSEETAKCMAMAQVRAANVRPIIHDAIIMGSIELVEVPVD
jgi:hypothetical protein